MTTMTIFFYISCVIIAWIIFYYVVKAAVRNGIKEAMVDKDVMPLIKNQKIDKPANAAQLKLQQRYNNGEITFETFQSEWDKLT